VTKYRNELSLPDIEEVSELECNAAVMRGVLKLETKACSMNTLFNMRGGSWKETFLTCLHDTVM